MGNDFNKMEIDNIIIFGAGSYLAKKICEKIKAKNIICISKSLKKKSKKNIVIFKNYKYGNINKVNRFLSKGKSVAIFFNNFTKDNLIINKSIKEITKELKISVIETFENSKNISKIMLNNKFGTLIFVGSTRGLHSDVGISGYAVSKNAIYGLAKSFSRELARYNITSNYLSLGLFNSPLYNKINSKIKDKLLERTDTKNLGDIQSLVNAINFIHSSRYVTGSMIKIDGGFI